VSDPLSILILDDEPIVVKRLEPALTKEGYDVEAFQTSKKALERILEKTFDIVITDIYMEEVDGFQILERVLERSPRTKVIVITGYAMMEMARDAMAKGAFDFIAKPFKPDDLREVILKASKSLADDLNSQ